MARKARTAKRVSMRTTIAQTVGVARQNFMDDFIATPANKR